MIPIHSVHASLTVLYNVIIKCTVETLSCLSVVCVSAGEEDLRSEEEEPGAGEVQVCPGLQDQGAAAADGAQREQDQEDEGADQEGQALSLGLVSLT